MINSRSLTDLFPCVQSRAERFLKTTKFALPFDCMVIVTSTLRDNEYQQKIYDQGRTTPGKIVTNSKPGSSFHNWKCAFDIALTRKGVVIGTSNTDDLNMWKDVGKIGQACGLTWGGDWNGDGKSDPKDWDFGHYQYTGGLTLAQLAAGKTPV